MYNKKDPEDDHDYSPNELAYLSNDNPKKYKEIVQSNLDEGDTLERWRQRNLEYAQQCLHERTPKLYYPQ